MSSKSKSVLNTVVFLFAVAGLLTGIFVWQHLYAKKKIDANQFHGTYLENPRAVNQFVLEGIDHQIYDNSHLKGQWTLMFFGFTNCGYLCPTTMAELAKMYRILEKKGVKQLPQVVMISIDPDRDTLNKLKHYVQSFHTHFYGARGDESLIKQIAHEMGIAFAKVVNKESHEPQNYEVEHSGAVILFNPQGELNAFFTTPHRADLLVKDYLLLVS